MTKKLCILVFAFTFFSCNQREAAKANTELLYFDLKGYFGKEIIRLKNARVKVDKTVSINGISETKSLLITDWEKELAIFINADINKNSWKGSFKVTQQNGLQVYTSDSKKIPVKKVSVNNKGLKISKVEIIINNKNILYQSLDTLTYYPEILYKIRKQQKIRLLAPKDYTVVAKFNP
ncbi:hypothetical protein GJU39_18345 [Pedobacter petrophilus]|uniref:DUF4292 domain-containing protein n=1 Tax=Pedobacter petrophilus TaxID=1908241 RepID=A0A7K0G2J4_9SPHI|nr:hypothetical protein [Pedobacter petrophilus]MRX78043.1 hypothetical protein [Pedobacter petrophilus]